MGRSAEHLSVEFLSVSADNLGRAAPEWQDEANPSHLMRTAAFKLPWLRSSTLEHSSLVGVLQWIILTHGVPQGCLCEILVWNRSPASAFLEPLASVFYNKQHWVSTEFPSCHSPDEHTSPSRHHSWKSPPASPRRPSLRELQEHDTFSLVNIKSNIKNIKPER